MALLWENLSSQLESVRSSTRMTTVVTTNSDATFDGTKTRQQRLEMALAAAQKAGNKVMVSSLTAVLEGREPQLDLPSFPEGINLPTYTFSVVPQQSARKSADQWMPILAAVSEASGVRLRFVTERDIPEFERTLREGKPDIAYMNPYHYEVFHEAAGYEALARAKDKRIKGILVARKDSNLESIEDLAGLEVAFPAPAAFAATLLPRAEMARMDLGVRPRFVSSHDSVYRNVASGTMPVGGGVVRTFNAMPPDVVDQLQVIWTSEGFTPHAIAAHPRVPQEVVERVQAALIGLDQAANGASLLAPVRLNGFERGEDADWDDVRALGLEGL